MGGVPRDPSQPAPGALERLRAFVNTTNDETPFELLTSPVATQRWLSEQGLWSGGRELTARDVTMLRRFRSALRDLISTGSAAAAGRVNQIAHRGKLRVVVGETGDVHLHAAGDGASAVVANLMALVHAAAAADQLSRLKTCAECGWSFFDRSKNRSGTWCSMQVCGSRVKSRRYRRGSPR